MPRANRYHLAGHVWHITHRCHRQQFLLKFARDRRAWVGWLYEARKRHGLCVLDYTVTSNHIHLLVRDQGREEIADSMQLLAGCTGQAFNQRKERKGAFWEDRYHATAVDTGEHLARCVAYIDLNMVRAGVVRHPAEWETGGYHEIQQPRTRFRIIDREALAEIVGIRDLSQLATAHTEWIATELRKDQQRRVAGWSESVAVGRREFVEQLADNLGERARYREIEALDDKAHILREPSASYGHHFGGEMGLLSSNSA